MSAKRKVTRRNIQPSETAVKKMKEAVDRAGEIQEKIAAIEAEHASMLADATKELREDHAKLFSFVATTLQESDKMEFVSDAFTAKWSSKKETDIDTKELFLLCGRLKKDDLFFQLVKTRLTEAKNYLGEAVLKDIWTQTVNKFSRCAIKRNKGTVKSVAKTNIDHIL